MTASNGPVERATRAELRELGISVQKSASAAAAVAMARHIDTARGGVAAATATRELRAAMEELHKVVAARPTEDPLADLRARRDARRTG